MLITKKGYYFIKVVLFFAFSKKESFPIKEISKRLDVSEKILEQVLLSLKNMGMLSSKRGPQGGYWLSSDISNLTVMDLLDMAGKKLTVIPVDLGVKPKAIDAVLGELTEEMEEDLVLRLRKLKVKDLVSSMKEKVTKKGLSYMI